MISIHASFKDCIKWILHFKNQPINTTKTVVLSKEDNSKEEILQVLKDSLNFEFGDECLECEVYLTEEEIEEKRQYNKRMVQSQINRLRKWCNMSEDYKEEIFTYLKYKNLGWLIEQI